MPQIIYRKIIIKKNKLNILDFKSYTTPLYCVPPEIVTPSFTNDGKQVNHGEAKKTWYSRTYREIGYLSFVVKSTFKEYCDDQL